MTKQELLDLMQVVKRTEKEMYKCSIHSPAYDLIHRFDVITRELYEMQKDIERAIKRIDFVETKSPKEDFHDAYAVMEYLKTRDRSLMLQVHDLMQTKVPANVIKQLFRDYYGTDDEYREMTCKVSTYVTLVPIDNQ